MTMIKDIKKLLRSKKGAAIEMAILLMVVIFLFSALITVAFLSTHSTYKRQVDKMTESALIDSFGEAFVKSSDRQSFALGEKGTGYTAVISNGGSTLTIKDAESETIRLVVTVSGNKVTSWQSFVETEETHEATVSDTQETTP